MMQILFLSAIFNVVAIVQVRHLSRAMHGGGDWIANRLGLTAQGSSGTGGGGGGGGARALGMGTVGASNSMPTHILAGFAAASTISGSPITGWLAGGVPNAGQPQAWLGRRMKKKQAKITDGQEGPWSIIGGERGIYTQSMLKYKEFGEAMRRGAGRHGVDSYMGAALGMDLVKVSGGLRGDMMGAFMGAGGRDEELHSVMKNSWGKVEESAENNMFKDGDLAHVVSAVRHAERSSLDLVEGSGNAAVAAADIATLNAKVFRYREGKSRSSLRLSANEENVAKAYLNDPTLDQVKALQAVIDKKMDSDLGGQWGTRARYLIGKGIDDVGARRVLRYIGDRQSLEVMKATEKLVADPTNIHNMRAVRAAAAAAQETDRFTSGVGASQGSELTPPSPADPKAKWVAKYRKGMLPAARELRR